MSRLGVADIAQRGVTLGLFGITLYGAAVFVDGGYDIVKRRFTGGPIPAAPTAPAVSIPDASFEKQAGK